MTTKRRLLVATPNVPNRMPIELSKHVILVHLFAPGCRATVNAVSLTYTLRLYYLFQKKSGIVKV